MTHVLNQAPALHKGESTTGTQEAPNAAAIVKDAAALLDPSVQPDTPYELPKISLLADGPPAPASVQGGPPDRH